MPISPEQREQVAVEVKRFATDLNLSEDQKGALQGFLIQAYERLQEYKTQNPNASKEDVVKKIAEHRSALRERLVKFLTPEQLTKWDSAMAKAKEFLGQKMAASA
jgi:protein CpxP